MRKFCILIFFYFYILILFGGIFVLKDIEIVYVNKDFKLKIINLVFDIYLVVNC